MTEQAVNLGLREAAASAAKQVGESQRQRLALVREQYRDRAREQAAGIAFQTLGNAASAGVEWEPTGDDTRTKGISATAVIDGLRFLATSSDDSFARGRHLYLLRSCTATFEGGRCDGEERAEVYSLSGLGELLAQPEVHTWDCPTCSWRNYEAAENAEQFMPQEPPPPTVAQQLENAIRSIVADELDARGA